MTGRPFGPWRRRAGLAQAGLFLGVPFLRVNGESALRLDVPAGRLHALGASFTLQEAFVVLAAVLLATFAFLLATLLLGRAWCGWSCPQTVLSDLTAWIAPGRPGRPRRWRRAAGLAAVALVAALFSAALLWYFVPPAEFAARLSAGRLGPVLSASWAVLAAALFADLALVRQGFCAAVCPYARLQGVLLDRDSLVVAYDAGRAADCVDCGACLRVCPAGIDIREGLQVQCIACAACVDACAPVMRGLRRPPALVGYFLGGPGRPRGGGRWRLLLRPAALALAAGVVLSGALLAGVVAGRGPVELEAAPDPRVRARRAAGGEAVNVFLVRLESRRRGPVEVRLAMEPGAAGGALAISPAQVALAPGERRQVRVRVTAGGLPPGRARVRIVGEVRAGERPLGREDVEVSLVIPELGP